MVARSATTKFTRSHKVGKREVIQDARGECIPTNSGFVRPDGRGRLLAEVSRLGNAEVERLMLALHRKFRGSKLGVKGRGMSIDRIRHPTAETANVAMTFRFPARELTEALRVLNSKPRTTTPKQREANRRNATKAVEAKADKRQARERAVEARIGKI